MILKNDSFVVSIELDHTFAAYSAGNSYCCDKVLFSKSICNNYYYKILIIKIDNGINIYSIALVGDYFSYDVDCAVLHDDILTVLQNDTLTCISLSQHEIVKAVKLRGSGTNFAIYKCKNGYLIYGEESITNLDREFIFKWKFMGRDIFVTQNENEPFSFDENKIMLYDWDNNYYELDYNGNLINM